MQRERGEGAQENTGLHSVFIIGTLRSRDCEAAGWRKS